MMRGLFVLLLLVLLSGCHRLERRSGMQTVRIATHREPIAFLPFRAAETLGYFGQEGLAVRSFEVAGGAKAMEALLGGSVDVAAGSLSDTVQLVAQGRHVRSFLVFSPKWKVALAVSPGINPRIRTVRDLKGHTVGVSAPGSASHQFLKFLLISNGLSGHDVSTVSVGLSATSVAALEHRHVDAAVLIGSAITMFEDRHPGELFLADTRTDAGSRQIFGSEIFPSLTVLAQESWLEEHSDAAQRLVRALKRAMEWIREHPAEQVRSMIPEHARMPSAEAELRAVRETQEGLSSDGTVPSGSAETVVKFLKVLNPDMQAVHVDAGRAYTNAFASSK